MNTEEMTIKDWLQELANSNTSTEKDDKAFQIILRRIGFPKAIVTCGIVYFEGQGTIEAPPMSINSVAKYLFKDKK